MKIWQSVAEREASPVVLVCEEAHRYVPNSGEAQYEAAQSAIKRVAKEGRKYGIGLLLVSQRPSEVETTVLSQCNSWIVLRITNEADRAHVRGVLPDSMAGLTKMLAQVLAFSERACRTKAICPSCSAPIVGTRPRGFGKPPATLRSSSTVSITLIATAATGLLRRPTSGTQAVDAGILRRAVRSAHRVRRG